LGDRVLLVKRAQAAILAAAQSVTDEAGPYDLLPTSGPDVLSDGWLSANEECDDGNIEAGDGCSSVCQREWCG